MSTINGAPHAQSASQGKGFVTRMLEMNRMIVIHIMPRSGSLTFLADSWR
jgi:hypothetical protein